MTGPGQHGEATVSGSPSEVPEPQRSMVTSRARPGAAGTWRSQPRRSGATCRLTIMPGEGSTASGMSARPRPISAERRYEMPRSGCLPRD
jgi:hypothetical protein